MKKRCAQTLLPHLLWWISREKVRIQTHSTIWKKNYVLYLLFYFNSNQLLDNKLVEQFFTVYFWHSKLRRKHTRCQQENERRQDAIFSITRRYTDRFMLKSGGGNGTSFLNSRKAKSVLLAFYCWRVAWNSKKREYSRFCSLGNSFSSLRILIPSDENYFSSLAISFSSDGIFISSDIFSIICRDFFTKVRSFPRKEGKLRKKQADFLQKHQEVAKFGLRVKYAPGKGFNQLNFIPL